MSLTKPHELDIPERPFKIYWHNKFLRSYDNKEEMLEGVNFFNKFLIMITYTDKE